jgi:hypothetical protein
MLQRGATQTERGDNMKNIRRKKKSIILNTREFLIHDAVDLKYVSPTLHTHMREERDTSSHS